MSSDLELRTVESLPAIYHVRNTPTEPRNSVAAATIGNTSTRYLGIRGADHVTPHYPKSWH
jgi:hypothetical protein